MRSIAGFRRKYNRTTISGVRNNARGSVIRSPASDQPAKSPSNRSIGSSSDFGQSSPSPDLPKSPSWNRPVRSQSFRSPMTNRRNLVAQSSISGDKIRSQSSSPHPRRHRRQPSYDLCTIAEDRRISSNTLQKMAITTPAKQIALSPTITRSTHFYEPTKPKLQSRDPYNDEFCDHNMDEESTDCNSCWAFKKSRFENPQGCWFR